MKQSKRMSLLEAAINIAVGFGVALAAQIVILPMLGVAIRLDQNIGFALIMTVISFARGYLLRRFFEAVHIRDPLTPSLLAIAAERRRQVESEGYDAHHDDDHDPADLACAGAGYAINSGAPRLPPPCWPWSEQFWKPADTRRDLVRAGALIVAALDRLERMRKRERRSDVEV